MRKINETDFLDDLGAGMDIDNRVKSPKNKHKERHEVVREYTKEHQQPHWKQK